MEGILSIGAIYLVPVQCLETAFEVSLVSDTSTTTATCSSWIGANEQPVDMFFSLCEMIEMYTFL